MIIQIWYLFIINLFVAEKELQYLISLGEIGGFKHLWRCKVYPGPFDLRHFYLKMDSVAFRLIFYSFTFKVYTISTYWLEEKEYIFRFFATWTWEYFIKISQQEQM